MATQKINALWNFARHGVFAALVLGVAFVSVHALRAQDPPVSPAQTREALRQAIELYKAQDYEKAAPYFAFIGPQQQALSPTDRNDFAKFSAQNGIALKSRQDGAAQLRLAEDALKHGRTQDVNSLLKSLSANQYLTTAERQQVADLTRRAQPKSTGIQGKADAKVLLAAGRAALQKGDLAKAEAFATQADKESSLMPAWLQPWNDSAAKLRRDIQTARAKQTPASLPDAMPKNPEEPKQSTSKFGSLWPFGGGSSTPPKKDASERKIDEMMARQVVKDGFVFLQANDLEKAQFLAVKAKELNATWAPGEQTPDKLLEAIAQAKGITRTVDAKPAAKVEMPPANTDPHTLLKFARKMLDQKKYAEADKVCSQLLTSNARWGLFEDTPEKLRKDIVRSRQAWERDESVRVLVESRKLLAQGKLEEAEKSAYKARQLHGPYGVFDFGDRPAKLIEEIAKAKERRGPVAPDKTLAKEAPNATKAGVPFEVPFAMQGPNKNRAIAMVREARELERQGMLFEARQKALEARTLKVTFLPEEDSPDSVLAGLTARCGRQIVSHLQTAVKQASDAGDVQRFEKAQAQIMAARKLAHAFELDAGQIDQTAHQLQQVATGARPIHQVAANLPTGDPFQINPTVDAPTGDPKKDALRKKARERLAQAQVELSYGKTAQARKMAEELYNPEYGIQADVLKLIRSISAEEYNQRLLEAKRTFDAGLDAIREHDFAKARYVFDSIDVMMLPELYQNRYRDIMAMREMQIVQVGGRERTKIGATKIEEKRPTEGALANTKQDLIDEVKAKDAVQYQMLRQRGQEALRSAHDMFKNNQQEEAILTLRHYIDQVNLAGFESQKTNELKRLADARIQQYKTEIAEAKLNKIDKSGRYAMFYDETGRQRAIKDRQEDIVERMKVVNQLMKENKLKEAEVEVRKIRAIDPDNLAALATLHIISNKTAQYNWDSETHKNEKLFVDQLAPGLRESFNG